MSALYPELAGKTVPADALMEYLFHHHRHADELNDGDPYVLSLPLERWLRQEAQKR
jgi:hypothetical protein